MQNQAANPLENFLNAKYRMKELFGITMQEEDFIEKAYRIYRRTGNVAVAIHQLCVEVQNCIVKLPCNVEFVDAVTTHDMSEVFKEDVFFSYEENHGPMTSSYYLPDAMLSAPNRVNITKSQLHYDGQLIPYTIVGKNECLKFNEEMEGQKVFIIYRGQILDEDGLPALTNKEVDALAHWVAYEDTQKRVFMKEPGMAEILAYIKPLAEVKFQAACIPEYLSQNFFDELLNAKTRMDRKVYGSSYRLLR
jgi:hypothetical protein